MHLFTCTTTAVLLASAAAQSLGDVLAKHGSTSMLHGLLTHLKLMDTFEKAQNSTLLAMTDDAIIYLAKWGLNLTSMDPDIASGVLQYHFLEGSYLSSAPALHTETQLAQSSLKPSSGLTKISKGAVVKLTATCDGSHNLRVESGDQKIVHTVDTDIPHTYGVIHTINQALVLPRSLSETSSLGELDGFWNVVTESRMDGVLEKLHDVTVFLPRNKAVWRGRSKLESLGDKALETLIKDHVVLDHVLFHTSFPQEPRMVTTMSGKKISISGDSKGRIFVNHKMVTMQNVLISGGVAHVVDELLSPETDPDHDSPPGTIGAPWGLREDIARAVVGLTVISGVFIIGVIKAVRWRAAKRKAFLHYEPLPTTPSVVWVVPK
ncbi:fasciclin domain-containing protein [Colletotrichum limetticola]|uniref:Fasciclin domain-containing protein n=1 Tax=Colletotrichum limetticola TaxID=1209924 RepID=A0ABQ9PPY3_9PEZI|nr:fasciclin domain-containing protein [Colletotrichum limetticola]